MYNFCPHIAHSTFGTEMSATDGSNQGFSFTPAGPDGGPPGTDQNFNVDDLREEFERECDGGEGSPGACFSLGEWHQVVKRDYVTARAIFEKNCSQRDNANSCFNLAVLVSQGAGGEEDMARARQLLNRACKFGHARGCDMHGKTCLKMAQDSLSLGQKMDDIAEARQSFAMACAKDYAPSCFRLGHMYRIGQLSDDGKTPDYPNTRKFMKRTCDLGMASGCKNLAVMYKRGDGMDRPDEKKFQYYAKMTKDIAKATGERMGVKVAGL